MMSDTDVLARIGNHVQTFGADMGGEIRERQEKLGDAHPDDELSPYGMGGVGSGIMAEHSHSSFL